MLCGLTREKKIGVQVFKLHVIQFFVAHQEIKKNVETRLFSSCSDLSGNAPCTAIRFPIFDITCVCFLIGWERCSVRGSDLTRTVSDEYSNGQHEWQFEIEIVL